MTRSLCDLVKDVDCGDIEERASREQHGYASEGQLDHIHHLRTNSDRKLRYYTTP